MCGGTQPTMNLTASITSIRTNATYLRNTKILKSRQLCSYCVMFLLPTMMLAFLIHHHYNLHLTVTAIQLGSIIMILKACSELKFKTKLYRRVFQAVQVQYATFRCNLGWCLHACLGLQMMNWFPIFSLSSGLCLAVIMSLMNQVGPQTPVAKHQLGMIKATRYIAKYLMLLTLAQSIFEPINGLRSHQLSDGSVQYLQQNLGHVLYDDGAVILGNEQVNHHIMTGIPPPLKTMPVLNEIRRPENDNPHRMQATNRTPAWKIMHNCCQQNLFCVQLPGVAELDFGHGVNSRILLIKF